MTDGKKLSITSEDLAPAAPQPTPSPTPGSGQFASRALPTIQGVKPAPLQIGGTSAPAGAKGPPVSSPVPPEGWYANPSGPGQRYWDGTTWTDSYSQPPASAGLQAGSQSKPQRLATLYWVALAGFGLSVLAILVYSFDALRWIGDINGVVNNGDPASAIDAVGATSAVNSALTFVYVASLVTTACFLVWFFAAYKNLELIGTSLRFTRGWAIGSWFVPFLNLVRPKQIANDIWRGSQPGSGDGGSLQDRPVTALLHWWWGLYLAGNVLLGVGVAEAKNRGSAFDTVEHVLSIEKAGFYISLLGAAAWMASAVLIAICAHRITQAQDLRLASEHPEPFRPGSF